MSRLDHAVIGLFQLFYEAMLDRFGVRVGTFRMGLALTPVVADTLVRLALGGLMCEVFADGILFFGIGLFYDFTTTAADDRRQKRRDLKPINVHARRFQAELRPYASSTCSS